jgi:hypothetical protein
VAQCGIPPIFPISDWTKHEIFLGVGLINNSWEEFHSSWMVVMTANPSVFTIVQHMHKRDASMQQTR